MFENSRKILDGSAQEVFETVLATERLVDLDRSKFISSGEIAQQSAPEELQRRTKKHIDGFTKMMLDGWDGEMQRRWSAIHALVLKTALIHIERPQRQNAVVNFKSLVRFMDEELHAIFHAILAVAWDWFTGGSRSGILHPLQRGTSKIVSRARNISWDFCHMLQLRQQAATPTSRARVVIPHFLTFDRALADLFELCALKGCLIERDRQFPIAFPKDNPEELLTSVLTGDQAFVDQYLSPEAHDRRVAYYEKKQQPDVNGLVQVLERELSKYDTAA
jgi:hypothetical protein